MTCETETFMTLLRDPNHWWFELLVGGVEELVTGVLIGVLLWPRIRSWYKAHRECHRPPPLPVIYGKAKVRVVSTPRRVPEVRPFLDEVKAMLHPVHPVDALKELTGAEEGDSNMRKVCDELRPEKA